MRVYKDSLLVFAAGLSVLFFQIGGFWSATWLSKWMLIIALFLFAMSWWAARKTSLLYLPLMLYTFGSLLMLALYPQSPYRGILDDVTILALEKNALVGILEVAALLSIFASMRRTWLSGVSGLLVSIWAIGTIAIIALPVHGLRNPPNNGLWFGNPSMGASLLAILLPFVWATDLRLKVSGRSMSVWKPLTFLMTLWMIFRTGASVPWGVLGVTVAAYLVCKAMAYRRRSLLWTALGVCLLAAAMVGTGEFLLGHDFFDQNGRTEIWLMAWRWFQEHAYASIGFGYSSSQILLPIEQIMTKHFSGSYFLWLHNDWLQLAIEGGYIGMFCVFLAFFRVLTVTWKHPALFASFAGFAALGLFNYPLRMPIHCFCLTLICGLAEALPKESALVQCAAYLPFFYRTRPWYTASLSRL